MLGFPLLSHQNEMRYCNMLQYTVLIKENPHIPNPVSYNALEHPSLDVELNVIIFMDKLKVKSSLQHQVPGQLVLLFLILASNL